jgi:molybdate transport system regulatory protein
MISWSCFLLLSKHYGNLTGRRQGTAIPPETVEPVPRLVIRVELSETSAIGPGKIRLLEHIGETGSISAAGRAMGMSYRRAWLLVDELNRHFREPVSTAGSGGKGGGGAALTPFGRELVRQYREIEAQALAASSKHLATLEAAMKKRRLRPAKRRVVAD